METKVFSLRLTPEEHAILEDGASKMRMSKNRFIIYLLKSYGEVGDVKELVDKVNRLWIAFDKQGLLNEDELKKE